MCSPTIFVAMGASTGTASTLAAVSQIGLIAGGTMMSINAQKQAMRYQQQQAEFQAKQFKAKADGEYIQTITEENERKKKYLSQLSTNRALLSTTGITTDSASTRAFFKANKEVVKKDIQKIKLMGNERRLAALYGVQQADLSGRAAEAKYQSGKLATVGRSLMSGYPIAKEKGWV
jgi:hypothetical protein